jgi:hypothetical protein
MEPPEAVRQSFLDAGWYPGRSVSVPDSVPRDHPAREVLAAFGGLVILEREPDPAGDPLEELVFQALPPRQAVMEVWGLLLATRLVGVAEEHNAHGEFYLDAAGRCFGQSLMHDAFYFHGQSFAEAVEGMLFRRRSRPMLRPDQPQVKLYGVQFTADSPEVYRYK